MLSHQGKAAYYGPPSGPSQDAAASLILAGVAEMFLFGNASSEKPQPEKKGEECQHPEHFKFISYIFTQLNQAQKQKKRKSCFHQLSSSLPQHSRMPQLSVLCHRNHPATSPECSSWAKTLGAEVKCLISPSPCRNPRSVHFFS